MQLGEKLGLEYAVYEWIRLRWRPGADREPVILECRTADHLDRAYGYRPFSLNLNLSIYHDLLHQVDVLLGEDQHAGFGFA